MHVPTRRSKVAAYRPTVRVWVLCAYQCFLVLVCRVLGGRSMWSGSEFRVASVSYPTYGLPSFVWAPSLAREGPRLRGFQGKTGLSGATPVIRVMSGRWRYSATAVNAEAGNSVSCQPCSSVHLSWIPSLDSPSAGLESESTHSCHTEDEHSSIATCVHAAMWPTSSALEVPRMREDSQGSLVVYEPD